MLLDRDDADNRSDQLRIEGQLLYALSPHFSVGPYVQYGEIDDEIAGIDLAYKEQTLLGLTVLANFAAEGWVIPYALVSVGHADVEVERGFLNESDTGPFVSGGLGLRAFLVDWFAMFGELRYTHIDVGASIGGPEEEFGLFGGVSLLFGGREPRQSFEGDPAPRSPIRRLVPPASNGGAERLWGPQ